MPPPAHIDPTKVDMTKVVADRAAIRRINRHRFAIVGPKAAPKEGGTRWPLAGLISSITLVCSLSVSGHQVVWPITMRPSRVAGPVAAKALQ